MEETNEDKVVRTKQSYFNNPTKEEAILLSVVPGIELKNYLLQIGKLVNPNNIRFASILPSNEVCIYLTSKQLVDVLVLNFQNITIDEHTIKIRRLVATNNQKITLTNVSPTLPLRIIQKALESLNMKLLSLITPVKYNFPEKELMHIKSFTREVFVSNEESIVIPEKLFLTYEDTKHEISISSDSLICSKCKKTGHLAIKCNNESLSSKKNFVSLEAVLDISEENDGNEKIKIVCKEKPDEEAQKVQKRSSETSDGDTSHKFPKLDDGAMEVVYSEQKQNKKTKKKSKIDKPKNMNPSKNISPKIVTETEPPPLLIKTNIKNQLPTLTEPPPLKKLPTLTKAPLIIKTDLNNQLSTEPPPLTKIQNKITLSTEPPPLAFITTETNNNTRIEEIKIETTDIGLEYEENEEFLYEEYKESDPILNILHESNFNLAEFTPKKPPPPLVVFTGEKNGRKKKKKM